jgi:hypothetical protein
MEVEEFVFWRILALRGVDRKSGVVTSTEDIYVFESFFDEGGHEVGFILDEGDCVSFVVLP